jgi:hypothetical protein
MVRERPRSPPNLVAFVDDVGQYGKMAARACNRSGRGTRFLRAGEVRSPELTDHAGKADLDDRRTIGLHRPRGEEDLAEHI